MRGPAVFPHMGPYLGVLLVALAARPALASPSSGNDEEAAPAPAAPEAAPERGEYADSFLSLKPQVREFERDPANRYTYCIRSTAVYECLSYGSDGQVRRQRTRVLAHGTGFAYKEQGGETYLLTNQHVSEWPAVTDAGHRVDEVPAGCKRVNDSLKIVDNEEDDYGADDVPLTRVVSDEALDAAVVKAKGRLHLLPYRIGRSALLEAGDVVLVRGFPLGAFQAVNTGKVVNPYDHDEFRDWDHADFIIDAALSTGNSGSPVLALSKRTGEYELVGMFHAAYTRANQLNAVVGIDQLRDLMMTLKRAPHGPGREVAEDAAGPDQRAEFELALSQAAFLPYVALGPLHVGVRRVGGALVYEVFSKRFPLDDRRILVVVDRPVAGAFGALGEVWFGNERGLKPYDARALDAEVQGQLQGVLRRLHALSLATLRYRLISDRAALSREAVAQRAALQRSMGREAAADGDLAQGLVDLAERLSPRVTDPAVSYAAVLGELPQRLGVAQRTSAPAPAPVPAVAPAGLPGRRSSPSRHAEQARRVRARP